MKKYIYLLSIILLGATVACNEKVLVPDDNTDTVTYDMTVSIPSNVIATRGECKDVPVIDHIYVATFGRNQYLNEYVKAIPLDASGNVTDTYATTNATLYHFRVTLLATTSPRHVHIIANGPTYLNYNTRDTDLMLTEVMTTGYDDSGTPQGAYWAYFYLPSGTATWDSTHNKWGASPDLTNHLTGVKLIRNFARVKVVNGASNFRLTSFHVFRTESKGSIAMATNLSGGQNFLSTDSYANISATDPVGDIISLPYKGFTPAGVTLHDETAVTNVPWYAADGSKYQYVYESVKDNSSEQQPFIILKGNLTSSSEDRYFRIELTNDDGTSFPIYRNVDYTITIESVASSIVGATDPDDAVLCNGNVSTAVSSRLPELSDGYSALYVLFTDRTYANASTTAGKKVTFMYQYIPDIVNAPTTYASCEALELSELPEGGEHAIMNTDGSWYTQTGPEDGWYTVTYYVKPSADVTTSEAVSVFKLTGKTTLTLSDGTTKDQTLFRYVTTRLIPIQDFTSFAASGSETTSGTPIDITFGIPANLPQSMFPIDFSISDSALALNPRGTDMPLVTHADGLTYHFVKSVTWEEYKANQASGMTVTCEMKLIQDITSTEISLSNDYFETPDAITYPSTTTTE